MSYGQKSDIAIGFQNSWDNQVTAVGSFHFIPFLSESIGPEIPELVSQNIKGILDENESYQGAKTAGGDIECEAQPIALGALLRCVLDTVTVTTSDNIYTHTFAPRTSDFDDRAANTPVTVYKYLDDGGSAHLNYNLVGNTLELSLSAGDFLKAKVGFVGGNYTQTSALSATYPTGNRYTWDVASVALDGAADATMEEFTLTVEEGVEASHTLNNSQWPSRAKRSGFRTIGVSGTYKFDNQTEFQKFLTSSEQTFDVTLTGTTEIQSGYYETMEIKVPLLRHTELKPAAGGPGLLTASFTAKAKYDTTSTAGLVVTLINTQATY